MSKECGTTSAVHISATDIRSTLSAGREPGSASRARRFVSVCLPDELTELRENAELVTSELVTNVLVHTDSSPVIQVFVEADCLRVEVHDDCAVLPVGGILDRTAASGRGLVLVERLSHRWGVTRVPGAGKSVWFELIAGIPTPGDDLSAEDLLDMWDDQDDSPLPSFDVRPAAELLAEAEDAARNPGEPTHPVRIASLSTDLLIKTRSHLDDLVRDLTLITEAAAGGAPQDDDLLSLGCRLCNLVVELMDFRNEIRRQALDAAHHHEPTLTLELELPSSLRPRLIDYRDALDEADEFCANGRLLVPRSPTDHIEFRRWKLGRIIEQLPREITPTS